MRHLLAMQRSSSECTMRRKWIHKALNSKIFWLPMSFMCHLHLQAIAVLQPHGIILGASSLDGITSCWADPCSCCVSSPTFGATSMVGLDILITALRFVIWKVLWRSSIVPKNWDGIFPRCKMLMRKGPLLRLWKHCQCPLGKSQLMIIQRFLSPISCNLPHSILEPQKERERDPFWVRARLQVSNWRGRPLTWHVRKAFRMRALLPSLSAWKRVFVRWYFMTRGNGMQIGLTLSMKTGLVTILHRSTNDCRGWEEGRKIWTRVPGRCPSWKFRMSALLAALKNVKEFGSNSSQSLRPA